MAQGEQRRKEMNNRKTSGGLRNAWLWVLVVYIGIIYGNSLTPASISSRQSGFLLEQSHRFLELLGYDSAWLTEHIIRKTAHFVDMDPRRQEIEDSGGNGLYSPLCG